MATQPVEDEGESWVVMAHQTQEEVLVLRELLRAALVEAAPRLEVRCLDALRHLLRSAQRVRHAMQWYAQDVVASLLFLGVDAAGDVTNIMAGIDGNDAWRDGALSMPHYSPGGAPTGTTSVQAVHYVSASERSSCTAALCQLVVGGSQAHLSGKCMIEALYPLMGGAATRCNDDPEGPRQSSIAPSLFARDKRFQQKRGLASLLLDTLLFGRPDGLKALLRVLLFDDRIGHGATLDAAQQLVVLLIRSAPPRLLKQDRVVRMSSDDYLLCVCTQLRELLCSFDDSFLSTVSADKDDRPPGADLPRFLHNPRITTPMVKETLEERLHLFLVLCTNRLVHVPASSSPDHATCMRRLHAANKYLLGPTFSALSLRMAPKSEDDVTRSLRCLYSLAKGATLTPVHPSFVMVWDAVVGGVVDMTAASLRGVGTQEAWLKSSQTHVRLLQHIWNAVLRIAPSADEIGMGMATSAVGSTTRARKGTVVWRAVGHGCSVGGTVEERDTLDVVDRTHAMVTVFTACSDAHRSIRYAFFRHACRTAQQRVYTLHRSPEAAQSAVGSIHLLMASCDMSMWIDVASLHDVVEMVAVCMTLGPLLYRTSIALLCQTLTALDGTEWTRAARNQRMATKEHLLRINALVHDTQRMMIFADVFGPDAEGEDDARSKALAVDEAELAATIPTMVDRLDAATETTEASTKSINSPLVDTPFAAALGECCSGIESNLLTRTRAPLAISVIRLVALLDAVRRDASQHRDTVAAETRHRVLHLMVKALSQSDDVTVLGHAVTVTARCVLLGIIDRDAWVAAIAAGVLTGPSAPLSLCGCTVPVRGARDALVARLLDVQLAICDDDTDGVVTKRLDELAVFQLRFSLVEVLAHIPRDASREVFVRVAALHLIGQIASVTFPRVAVHWLTEFAVDVFRLSNEGIVKAAAAAMVSSLVMALHGRCDADVLSTVALEPLADIGRHLSSYQGVESQTSLDGSESALPSRLVDPPSHGDVIRLHGALVVRHLQQMSQSWVAATHPSPEPSFDWSSHSLNLWAHGSGAASLASLQGVLPTLRNRSC